jgi:hypothetical protein
MYAHVIKATYHRLCGPFCKYCRRCSAALFFSTRAVFSYGGGKALENFFDLILNLMFFERKQLREPGLVAAIGIGSSTETIYSVPILVIVKPSTGLCF